MLIYYTRDIIIAGILLFRNLSFWRFIIIDSKVVSLIKMLFYHIKKQKETFIKQKQKNKTKNEQKG